MAHGFGGERISRCRRAPGTSRSEKSLGSGGREVFELHHAGKKRVIRETRPLDQVNEAIAHDH